MSELLGRQSGSVTTAHLQVVFDGSAVHEGTIDALILADALASYSKAFTRANFLVNGSASEAKVLVDAKFDTGSFDVPLLLVQSFHQAQGVLGELKTALEIAVMLGIVHSSNSLVELLKFLKGSPPEHVTEKSDGVCFEFNGEEKIVPHTTSTLYYDPSIRRAMEEGTKSLENPGINSIQFQHESDENVVLSKEDIQSFKANELELQAETPLNGERDAVLTISKLSFKEGTKWSFFENGSSLTARIDDEEFFEQVHERKLKFADGDGLSVHLVWNLHNKNGRLSAENVITKVHRVLTRIRQIPLGGSQNEAE